MTRRTPKTTAARKLTAHQSRIHELLDQLRDFTDSKVPQGCDWGDVGDLAHVVERLAELVPCQACNGTGAASGRTTPMRRVDEGAAEPACPSCDGEGHVRA